MKLIAGLITILAGLGIAGYGLANGNFIVTGAGIIVIITGFKVLTS